jgi:hypothetical protein
MSTQALLDRLVARVTGGWQRSTGNRSLLKLIEMGQDLLVNEVYDKRVWIGSENEGLPPFLSTVAGTVEYEIIAANLVGVTSITQKIGGSDVVVVPEICTRVFIKATEQFYLPTYFNRDHLSIFSSDYLPEVRQTLVSIPVRSFPALENTPAKIIFPFDPATEDDLYYCEFVWQAPRLISQYIPLIVPVKFELALEEFVVGYCQSWENGGLSEFLLNFWSNKRTGGESWIDQYKAYYQRGAPIRVNRITPRVC